MIGYEKRVLHKILCRTLFVRRNDLQLLSALEYQQDRRIPPCGLVDVAEALKLFLDNIFHLETLLKANQKFFEEWLAIKKYTKFRHGKQGGKRKFSLSFRRKTW